MKIYTGCDYEYEEELFDKLKDDYRVQIHEGEIFCLDNDKDDLERQYDIMFVDAKLTLFYIFLGNRSDIVDIDLQFVDLVDMTRCNKILFYNSFERWLDEIRNMFDSMYNYNVKNYEECKKNQLNMLGNLSKVKY